MLKSSSIFANANLLALQLMDEVIKTVRLPFYITSFIFFPDYLVDHFIFMQKFYVKFKVYSHFYLHIHNTTTSVQYCI